MRTSLSRIARYALPVTALTLLPLRGDGGQAECWNATTSLAATVNDPTAGDESFFKLPTGPANVMLLLDVSGSMNQLPQCGDYAWNDSSALDACKSPGTSILPNPSTSTNPQTKVLYRVEGTCAPSGGNTSSPLAWMEKITPTTALPDPGRTNSLLSDKPTWGTGCVGNACLFDPNAYFLYGDWTTNSTGSSSTRRESDTDNSLPDGCTALTTGGAVVRDNFGNNPVDLGDACRTCMANHGFYFYRVRLATSRNASGYITGWSSTVTSNLLFKGTFLNANPPKFVAAKKVVKDIAWMDPANPLELDKVRIGLSILATTDVATKQRAKLVVPLGPAKDQAFPATQDKFRQARQYIISVLNYDRTIYKDSSGTEIIKSPSSDIQNGFFDPASTSTPLASALFNLGQYFTSKDLYKGTFGSTFQLSGSGDDDFNETSVGGVKAPWAVAAGTAQCSICWACQNNSIVVLTDGSPNSEFSLPSTITGYGTSDYKTAQNCGTTGDNCISPTDTSQQSPLPRVANWLHDTDLRDDKVMANRQKLQIFTIGYGVFDKSATDTDILRPTAILQATANLGGGTFETAVSMAELGRAVSNAINGVIPRENSFSAASANSLQTVQTAASEAYMTRFKPNQSITWEGHVFQGILFDEFLNGCDPTKSPAGQPEVSCGNATPPRKVSASFKGTLDPVTGLAACSGVYLVDLDCDEIVEDSKTGDFIKKGTAATPARFPWDAGAVLSDSAATGYRSADDAATNKRNIFTWVNGAKVDLTAANAATLKPYMNIESSWCDGFLSLRHIAPGTDKLTTCAQNIIHFVRGWDVLDQDSDGCAGPGQTNPASCASGTKGEERNRANDGNDADLKVFWKLGDVFHSSPAVVQAPFDEFRCDTGYEKQCLSTIHSPSFFPKMTPMNPSDVDQYKAYQVDQAARKRVVLVGANDGMLHAFDAGTADTTKPKDLFGAYPYSNGDGAELWAFVPPDLLPKLKQLVDEHVYMVDGSVMLRDVWVDANTNYKKDSGEFHTVAVFGRRSGGAAYTALDVTNPTAPTFLWTFPGTGTEDSRYMGQSWSDFAPRPPPIGPVRLANAADPRKWEERWIVMINGGYDPALNLGRAVFMLDVWTGKTLWRFTDDDFKSNFGYGSGTSMFPVPAGIGLADVGSLSGATLDSDGFFDTATWGDLGGNVFVARFLEPGKLDPTTKRVTNWFAARTFEQQRKTDDSQYAAGRNEFYFMTSNTYDPTTHTLRTFLGSGNREQIMSTSASCGTDNLLGCAQAGCTKVTSSTTLNWGGCNATSSFSAVGGKLERPATSTTAACTSTSTCAAAPGNIFSSSVALHWECPGATTADSTGSVSCNGSGLCSVDPVGQRTVTGTFTAPSKNRFYGLWSYGRSPSKMFDDPDETKALAAAKVFDQNRFTDVTISKSCAGTPGNKCELVETTYASVKAQTTTTSTLGTTCTKSSSVSGTKCAATVDDAGWFYEYGNVCPLSSCATAPPWTDEKTGSGSTIVNSCTTWGGFRPFGMVTTTDPCTGDIGAPVTYGYASHYISGTPTQSCGYQSASGNIARASQRTTTAPPTAATVRVTFNAKGQVAYSALQIDAGSPPANKSLGVREQVAEPVYWIEVPRQLHDCRHDAAKCAASCQ